jgi:mannose-1-phosphate guanylyltransferase
MDTAAAIGLETIVVAGDEPDVIIASLGSDHYIGRPEEFIKALRAAEGFLKNSPQFLVAIACEPTRVETNYGHIRKGRALAEVEGLSVHEAAEFTEKPNLPTAQRYTESGQYLWNANFLAWRAGTLLEQFKQFEPEMHGAFKEILSARGTKGFARVLQKECPTLKRTAIDYAVLEPAARKGWLAVIPVSMQWSDIGSWGTLTDAFPPDANGNLLVGPVLARDTSDTTVVVTNPRRKVVATIGIKGLAIVDTPDALLICPKELSGRVKGLVEELGKSKDYKDLV